jgi:hypothetical protein
MILVSFGVVSANNGVNVGASFHLDWKVVLLTFGEPICKGKVYLVAYAMAGASHVGSVLEK